MPVPTSYTEQTLATFMHTVLGNDEVAKALNWVEEFSYEEAIIETLLSYGVSDVTTVTGTDSIRKLRSAARLEVWRQVMERTAADYDVKIEGEAFSRSQFHDHAKAMFELAQKQAEALGITGYVSRPTSINTAVISRGFDT